VFQVRDAFSFDHNGRTYVMKRGEIITGDHPAYRGREALFETVTADAAREHALMRTQVSAVETATAEPGMRRRMEVDVSIPDAPPPPNTTTPESPAPPAPTPATTAPAPTPDGPVPTEPTPTSGKARRS
jgi:hypothetical protein